VSIQTTERYLGCKQKLRIAFNDKIGSSLPKRHDPAKGVRSPLGNLWRVNLLATSSCGTSRLWFYAGGFAAAS